MERKPGRSVEETKSGFYFFVATWLGSEVQKCSDGAKGFWVDCLCHMYQMEPRGVLPGDPAGLAAAFGIEQELAESWFQMKFDRLLELEDRGVFSRGADVCPSLEADAIVNRRMYRDYVRAYGRRAKAQNAANARWGRDAKRCLGRAAGDAHGHAQRDGDSLERKQVTKAKGCLADAADDAQQMPFPTLPYPNLTKPAETRSSERTRRSRATRVGETMGSIFGPDIVTRIQAVTRDGDSWKSWWESVVSAFDAAGRIGEVEEAVKRAQDATNPAIRAAKDIGEIKQPGRWLASHLLRVAREAGIRVPNMPKGARNA